MNSLFFIYYNVCPKYGQKFIGFAELLPFVWKEVDKGGKEN